MLSSTPSPPRTRRMTRQFLRLSTTAATEPPNGDTTEKQRPHHVSNQLDEPESTSTSSESDDEEGVFFGQHCPEEDFLLAKLSATEDPTVEQTTSEGSHSTTRRQSRRRSSLQLKAKDSREFHRRKTILPSDIEQVHPNPIQSPRVSPEQPKKIWQGGFYERRDDDQESDSEGECSTIVFRSTVFPLSSDTPLHRLSVQACDLTLDFAMFRMSDSPFLAKSPSLRQRSPTVEAVESIPRIVKEEEDDREDSSEFDGDSDKENIALEFEEDETDIEFDDEDSSVEQQQLSIMSLIMPASTEEPGQSADDEPEEDTVAELDMGGLKLSDFADPDDAIQGGDIGHNMNISLLAVRVSSESSGSSQHRMGAPDNMEDAVILEVGEDQVLSYPTEQTEQVAQDDTGNLSEDERDATPGSICGGELDSPLEVARGGPVIIPQMPYHLVSVRAETGSPFRTLPSPQSAPAFFPSPDLNAIGVLKTGRLSSSSVQTPSENSRTPMGVLNSNRSMPGSAGPSMITPTARGQTKQPEMLGAAAKSKMLKSSMPVTVPTSVDRPSATDEKAEKKVVARTLAIRGKLDAAFTGKLAAMGPPQRTVSGSSAVSGTSARTVSGSQRPSSRSSQPSTSARSVSFGRRPDAQSRSKSGTTTAGPSHVGVGQRPAAQTAGFAKPTLASSRAALGRRPETTSTMAPPQPARPSIATTRPPLQPRPLPQAQATVPARPPSQSFTKPSRPVPVTKAAPAVVPLPIPAIDEVAVECPPRTANPLKRPLPSAQSTLARSLVTTAPGVVRPMMGLPARLVQQAPVSMAAPVFSMGTVGPESVYPPVGSARPGFRSPKRFGQRTYGSPMISDRRLGTPSRFGMGTPSRASVRSHGAAVYVTYNPKREMTSAPAGTPAMDSEQPPEAATDKDQQETTVQERPAPISEAVEIREVEQAITSGPTSSEASSSDTAATAAAPPVIGAPTAFHTGDATAESGPPIDDPPPSSPSKPPPKSDKPEKERHPIGLGLAPGRPKRATRPPSVPSFHQPQPRHLNALGIPSIAPNLSEKELKVATQRNTARNEVYHCAIDRQIIRKTGQRPPSPTSKIPTIADREEQERKVGRDQRAKRRSRGSDASEEGDDDIRLTVVERISKFRGDEDDYTTPARPLKKAKISDEGKGVRWDKGLVIIRDRNDEKPISKDSSIEDHDWPRPCIRNAAKVELDEHGNVIEGTRPSQQLKRHRIPVTAVFYDGEEPVPVPPYPSSASKSKKK